MKKITIIILTLVTTVTLFGCNGQVDNKNYDAEPRSNLSKTYISMIELQKSAAEAGIEAVSKYVDLGEYYSRSAISDSIDFNEIGKLLPEDLSTLKRTEQKYTREAGTDLEVEEITLEEELSAIVEKFNDDFEKLIPNPEKALTLPFVSETEGGLQIGDDMIIPYNSIEGAVNIEILNALADGEDIERILKEFEEDIDSNFNLQDSSRSLWHVNTTAWKNGVINYRWGTISNDHKQAILDAMKEWSTNTNKISFEEIDDDKWTKFTLGIYATGCVTIDDKDLGGVSGESTIGYSGGNTSHLHLASGIDGAQLTNTALHELGHVLGLHHEHQRYDRDDYLSISSQDKETKAFEIIPKEIEKYTWVEKKIKILWWYLTIKVFTFRSKTNCYYSTKFDFDSVMLYPHLDVQPNKKYLNHNNDKTQLNISLSPTDISMIKSRY